jgi:uncharacterized protein (TIGR00290 family)
MEKEKVLFCWSGGKDSALCLHRVMQDPALKVAALLTTVNRHYERVTMHGVREALLDMQAASIGLPLEKVYLGQHPGNAEYERSMEEMWLKYKRRGVKKVIFGDLFLEDLRSYRESHLQRVGMSAVFPLWISSGQNYRAATAALLREFIGLGFKAITCCVSDGVLTEAMAGRVLDESFLSDLPPGVDPCGENGEFHTFVYDGPLFREPVLFEKGENVYRPLEVRTDTESHTRGFWFCDLLPV